MADSHTLENPEKKLKKYQQTEDAELRNQLILHYSYIAKSVAVQMRGITSAYAQVEDITNEGIIAILDCLDKFDASKGMSFENYAYMRAKSATIDFVRKQDWVPRRVRRTSREVGTAYNELATELMREPTNQELADYLGVTEPELDKHYLEMNSGSVLSFEDLLANAMEGSEIGSQLASESQSTFPEKNLMENELRDELANAIDALTERERTIISLYYYENLKLREIAEIIGVSESRISQIHTQSILQLNHALTSYLHGEA